MPVITLPNGATKEFDRPVSVYEVAASIGSGLANAALAGKINGTMVDLSTLIENDAAISIITEKDPEGLDVIRHSCAHLLAQAVKSVYPEVQVTIGPVIDDGFFYDFSYPKGFTTDDLALFEAKMLELSKEDIKVERSLMSRDEAIKMFEGMGEKYKVEIIQDIDSTEKLSFYRQREFIDLCRGPHVPSTAKIKAFKLTKLAGAYWRGDSNNEMLQRVYGTAWASKKDLDAYLARLEEAEKRDHRKLAKKFDLFHLQEEAPGMAFWHPKGWSIYRTVERYISNQLDLNGYEQVRTPQVVDRKLWEKSGHWEMFASEMFTIKTDDDKHYAVKPMNCPCHIQIFNQGMKSYRDLPIRLAEFGCCHRNEPSGALHGIMRARSFVQDDAHIFCTEDQIQTEVSRFIDFLFKVYQDFGFSDVLIKLSTRPEKRVGADEVWDKAESALEVALNNKNLNWQLLPGEGAFYGPKIEFSLKDCIGRVWQCGTIQVDFSMPSRLGAEYVAEDGSRQTPVMLHRAILGSLERFIGILVEEYAGSFPAWLAPVQVAVCNITDRQAQYVADIQKNLQLKGFRVITDLRNEKIGFKIREHTIQRVPYLLVVGDKEVEQHQVAVRTREGEDLGSMTLDQFTDTLKRAIDMYSRPKEKQSA